MRQGRWVRSSGKVAQRDDNGRISSLAEVVMDIQEKRGGPGHLNCERECAGGKEHRQAEFEFEGLKNQNPRPIVYTLNLPTRVLSFPADSDRSAAASLTVPLSRLISSEAWFTVAISFVISPNAALLWAMLPVTS